jgi:DNA-binding NarL/FixJ family response regulator
MHKCGNALNLLPFFSRTPRGYPSAASWVLSSDIRLKAGFASSHRLMLLGLFNMALYKPRLAFMVTTEAEALQNLKEERPGLLISTQQLEQGSGLGLVEAAPLLVSDIRSVLIVDPRHDDLVLAGRSRADAVLCEADCFTTDQPIVTLIRSLAVGQRYRSGSVVAVMEAASVQRQRWRGQPPDLSARELELVALLVEGLSDRKIALRQEISYETARSRGKALRSKLGVSNRSQLVARALQLGQARFGVELPGRQGP